MYKYKGLRTNKWGIQDEGRTEIRVAAPILFNTDMDGTKRECKRYIKGLNVGYMNMQTVVLGMYVCR